MTTFHIYFFIFLICIYTHIVKQITKQIYKYLMPFCTNYKLYLALVFQIRIEKVEFW